MQKTANIIIAFGIAIIIMLNPLPAFLPQDGDRDGRLGLGDSILLLQKKVSTEHITSIESDSYSSLAVQVLKHLAKIKSISNHKNASPLKLNLIQLLFILIVISISFLLEYSGTTSFFTSNYTSIILKPKTRPPDNP